MRELVVTLLVSVVVSASVSLRPRAAFDGAWRLVLPGGLTHFGVIIGAVLTVLTAWVWLFVGSRRADAEAQLRILWWLNVGFAVSTLFICGHMWRIRRRALRWRDDRLVWRNGERRFSDIAAIEHRPLNGVTLRFNDGERLSIDESATHALALLQAVHQHRR